MGEICVAYIISSCVYNIMKMCDQWKLEANEIVSTEIVALGYNLLIISDKSFWCIILRIRCIRRKTSNLNAAIFEHACGQKVYRGTLIDATFSVCVYIYI